MWQRCFEKALQGIVSLQIIIEIFWRWIDNRRPVCSRCSEETDRTEIAGLDILYESCPEFPLIFCEIFPASIPRPHFRHRNLPRSQPCPSATFLTILIVDSHSAESFPCNSLVIVSVLPFDIVSMIPSVSLRQQNLSLLTQWHRYLGSTLWRKRPTDFSLGSDLLWTLSLNMI